MKRRIFFFIILFGLGFYIINHEKDPVFNNEKIGFFISQVVAVTEDLVKASERQYLKDYTFFKKDLQDFLEIDLSEMRVTLFKKGEVVKQADILLKGDAFNWGGTAAGLYKIKSGWKIAFSSIAEAYMPFALGFYGKYYLHGIPYYYNGEKLLAEASGGCLRVSDHDAEDFYEQTEMNMPVLVIDKKNKEYNYRLVEGAFPSVTAVSYLVADLDSGFIFTEKGLETKRQIASLTKLMTAVVISENIDLRRSIQVKDFMLNAWGETDLLVPGNYFKVVELFYPLLIESSNDAAEVLSYFLGRKYTINLMNEKAKAIFMPETIFTCPSGYDEGNISTAQDLYYLARYIFNNRPLLFEITRSKMVPSFGEVQFDVQNLWNKNTFSADETFLGGKTGYIKTSGYNGLFIFKIKNRNILFVVLGSEHLADNKKDTQKLYLWVEKNFF